MARWRAARDAGSSLPPAEQAELDALVEAEVRAAGRIGTDAVYRLPAGLSGAGWRSAGRASDHLKSQI